MEKYGIAYNGRLAGCTFDTMEEAEKQRWEWNMSSDTYHQLVMVREDGTYYIPANWDD